MSRLEVSSRDGTETLSALRTVPSRARTQADAFDAVLQWLPLGNDLD